jgi:hypothetical protein
MEGAGGPGYHRKGAKDTKGNGNVFSQSFLIRVHQRSSVVFLFLTTKQTPIQGRTLPSDSIRPIRNIRVLFSKSKGINRMDRMKSDRKEGRTFALKPGSATRIGKLSPPSRLLRVFLRAPRDLRGSNSQNQETPPPASAQGHGGPRRGKSSPPMSWCPPNLTSSALSETSAFSFSKSTGDVSDVSDKNG